MAPQNKNQEHEASHDLKFGRFLSHPPPGEEIVVSGMSGYFPDTKSTDKFAHNLFNNIDMINEDESRWEHINPEIPKRYGKVPEINKFDNGFFGIHEKQAHLMCIMCKMSLERAAEAIFDAGFNPKDLQGTKTGVFVGSCNSDNENFWCLEKPSNGVALTGTTRSMTANRISYYLKVNGPSFNCDTACSSSFYAFEEAYKAIRMGQCDSAVVVGAMVSLHPHVNLQFARLGVLSMDGHCKVFDEEGNGYCRAEAVSAVFLQKAKDAKRIYATVLHSKTNCDGYKEQGITYPSGEAQKQLLNDFYNECQIDPNTLSYFEAHGTGTKVGDPEEIVGIDEIFCKNRKTPMLIGSVKSNIGHTEPTSGLCSLVKCIIGYETGYIPPNVNYNKPRIGVTALEEGRLQVVTEKTPFADDRGLIGINNFGFGGANSHVLIKWNTKEKNKASLTNEDLPRLVCASSRVENGIHLLLDEVRKSLDKEYIALLHDLFKENIETHIYRGYSIINKDGEVLRTTIDCNKQLPLHIVFSGYERNWKDVVKVYWSLPLFQNSIDRIENILNPHKINIINIIHSNEKHSICEEILGSTVTKLAISDVFKQLKVQHNGIVGYSLGEIVCAYFDNCLTLEQAVLSTLKIAKAVDSIYQPVVSYLVNLDLAQLSQILPPNVNVHAINSINSVIIGGHQNAVVDFVTKLGNHNIEIKELGVEVVDFYGEQFSKIKSTIIKEISSIIPNPKSFSNNHVLKSNNRVSAEFLVNTLSNIMSLKDFASAIEKKPLVLEIGFGYLESALLESTENYAKALYFDSKNGSYLIGFLDVLGRLYEYGINPQIQNLYPKVEFPVSRGTPSISSHIKWNRDITWPISHYKSIMLNKKTGIKTYQMVFDKDGVWRFAHGHIIDGRNLFPATGYLKLVWETVTLNLGLEINETEVVFENCKFLRAVTCPKQGELELTVSIQRGSGNFEVSDGDQAVVTGTIYIKEVDSQQVNIQMAETEQREKITMTSKDIYKELRLRGYNYSGLFKSLDKVNNTATKGTIKWHNNWVAFLDNILQIQILQIDSRMLYVPTSIRKMTINAKKHLKIIRQNGTDESSHVDVFLSPESHTIRCGGVQIDGLSAAPIVRRKLLGEPVLEKYMFVPNVANLNKESSARVNMQIVLENKYDFKIKVAELIDEFTQQVDDVLGPLIHNVLADLPLIRPEITILSKNPMELQNVTVENKTLAAMEDCLVIIASEVLSRPALIDVLYKSLKDYGYILSREKLDIQITPENTKNLEILTVHSTETEKLVLMRKSTEFKRVTSININNAGEDFTWVPKLQNAVAQDPNVVVYSLNEPLNGILGLVNCIRREPGTNNVRCVFTFEETPKFDPFNPFYYEQLKKNLAFNIFKNGQWGTYRHLVLEQNQEVMSEHCYVNTTTKGDLSSLKWIEGPLRSNTKPTPEKSLVFNYYCAVNFRDIMMSTGKLTPDVVVKDRTEQDIVQGFEFAGRLSCGRRVFGLFTHGCFASLINVATDLMWDVPEHWSLEDAVTVPVVYLTVIWAFLERIRIKKGDKILIHSGTGGIGQAAIQIALHFGCEVFTTVGTQEKREYIKKRFPQLTDNVIGNSRDTSFEKMIMTQTHGRGVDVVLNSLSEEKLEAGVRCLAKGGIFLEIGKFDLSKDSPLMLQFFKNEQSFHGIMLDGVFAEIPFWKKHGARHFVECLKAGAIKPLDRTLFKENEFEKAFRYMATGKHMGKVVFEIRKEEDDINAEPQIQYFKGIPRYFCDSEKSYIIAGGLGGFGLELADWIILRGARNLVLVSRTGIKTGYQTLRMSIWKSYGVIIKISTANISTKEGCRQLLEEATSLGPVAGIFNLAVVLKDAILENQSIATFKESYEPKALATKYLDQLSREMCPELSDFVIFSSVSCGRGNAGQTNYGLSNSVMERVCEQRRADNLPALAIEWGAIGEVGLVADMQEENTEIEIGGTLQQKISSCLQVLDSFMRCNEPIVSSIVVAEKKSGSGGADNIIDAVAYILGIKDLKTISYHSSLAELGMDSMTAVEIKQTMEREFDVFLTAQDIRSMTFARLMEIQDEKSELQTGSGAKQAEIRNDLFAQFVKIMGEEGIVNLPIVPLNTKLSDREPGPKVLFYPGIEGVAEILNELSIKLYAHAVAIQYCPENHGTTIEEMADISLPYAEQYLSKDEPFIIVAHSIGVLVALEAVKKLEDQGYIGHLICLDGSPTVLRKLVGMHTFDSEQNWETIVYLKILSQIVHVDVVEKNAKILEECATFEERFKVFGNILGIQAPLSMEHYKGMASGTFKRLFALKEYTPKNLNIKSKVTLIRPTVQIVANIENDYGLSKVVGTEIEVSVVEADHLTILNNPEVSDFINKLVNPESINNQVNSEASFGKENIIIEEQKNRQDVTI